jgi:hypothetical protein
MATTMKTPTFDERIVARRIAWVALRAARKDPDDMTLSPNARRDYLAETTKIDQEIAAFNTTVEKWQALPSIEPDTRWLDFLTPSRATLSAELMAIKSPIRDKSVMELASRLDWAIKLLDHGLGISTIGAIVDLSSTPIGQLMMAAGFDVAGPALRGPNGFRGSIKETEQRIKELTKQHADARAALDLVLRSDEERATQDAESAALNVAFNGLHAKFVDGGYVAHTDDGDVIPASDLTDIQKRAIDRSNALERAYRQSVIDRQSGRA